MDVEQALELEKARFDFLTAHHVSMMSIAQLTSQEEYDALISEYYSIRCQHQAEMLRLNQVLYLNSQRPSGGPTEPPQPVAMVADEVAMITDEVRPALTGINTNMQTNDFTSRKRTFSGYDEEGENKRGR